MRRIKLRTKPKFLLLHPHKSQEYGLSLVKKIRKKKKKKSGTHPSANVSAYALHGRSISLTRKKKHGCSEQAFIANGHTSSRRKSRKTMGSEDVHANEGRLLQGRAL